MKASKYLLKKLSDSRLFDESKSKDVATAIVKNQKISSICENKNEELLWSNNLKSKHHAR